MRIELEDHLHLCQGNLVAENHYHDRSCPRLFSGSRGYVDDGAIDGMALVLERASRDDRARDPRMWKQLRIEARKRTRCVTSEFQLGFSQLEPWYIYSSLTNDYHNHVTRSME